MEPPLSQRMRDMGKLNTMLTMYDGGRLLILQGGGKTAYYYRRRQGGYEQFETYELMMAHGRTILDLLEGRNL